MNNRAARRHRARQMRLRGAVWLVGLCCALSSITSVRGGDWHLSRQIGLEGTWMDSADSSTTQESDFVARLTPGLVVTGQGGRLQMNLAYALQALHYMSSGNDSKINHNLQANAQSELYREHLFLDMGVSIRQDLIDPLGPSSGDSLSATDNLQTVSTYRIAPYYQTRLGPNANLRLGLHNDGVLYSEDGSDSTALGLDLSLLSGSRFSSFQWQLRGETEQLDYQEGSARQSGRLLASIGYPLSSALNWSLSGGYEINNEESISGGDGLTWQTQIDWLPNPRTNLLFGIGQRPFGWTHELNWNHRRKRAVWTASVRRELSSARAENLQTTAFDFEDAFGEPITPDTSTTDPIQAGAATVNNSDFISNAFQTGYTLQTRRSNFGINLGFTSREYGDTGLNGQTTRAAFTWTRRLGSLTSTNLGLGWNRSERDAPTATSDVTDSSDYTFNLGLTRTLSQHASAFVRYRFRDSDDSTENRVSLGLQVTWDD